MAGREAFQRFAQQLQQSSRVRGAGGGGGSGGSGPLPWGGAGLLALVGGGLLLNSALFNGMCICLLSRACLYGSLISGGFLQSMVDTE